MSNSDAGAREQRLLGRELHDPQGEVADALELGDDPQHRHDEAQVGRHRRLAAEQQVAALGERHVHGVDLVVGGDRPPSASAASPVRSTLAHALEVLVDAHAHQLHLEAQLVELLAEPVPQRLDRLGVGMLSRSGR